MRLKISGGFISYLLTAVAQGQAEKLKVCLGTHIVSSWEIKLRQVIPKQDRVGSGTFLKKLHLTPLSKSHHSPTSPLDQQLVNLRFEVENV